MASIVSKIKNITRPVRMQSRSDMKRYKSHFTKHSPQRKRAASFLRAYRSVHKRTRTFSTGYTGK